MPTTTTDWIRDLFSPDGTTERLDELVTSELQRFLASPGYGGAAAPAELADAFARSDAPEEPMPAREYLQYLFEQVVPNSVRTHSPRFIGHMTSALPTFTDPLGRVVTALNQNVVKLETSNAFTFYERQALAMLHRLTFQLPTGFYDEHAQRAESTLGMMVSGGTLANLAALWVARNRRLLTDEKGAGVEEAGLAAALLARGFRAAAVVGSSLMHYSFKKAVDLLGLGTTGLVSVPADVDGRIRAADARRTIIELRDRGVLVVALVAVAGTTETGAVDPLDELADVAEELGVHLHVDAAWGGPVLFSSEHARVLAGIERADTVTIDGHKQLYLPMGIGTVLLRDPTGARAIEKVAKYIIRPDSPDLGRRSLEGSRPAMAIFLHAAMHIIGRRGYAQLVDDGIAKARFMADALKTRDEFELLAPPTLNILVYRYLPSRLRAAAAGGSLARSDNEQINAVNRAVQEAQWRAGAGFISRTSLENTKYGGEVPIVCLRAVLANPLTSERDILAVLDEQANLGERAST